MGLKMAEFHFDTCKSVCFQRLMNHSHFDTDVVWSDRSFEIFQMCHIAFWDHHHKEVFST